MLDQTFTYLTQNRSTLSALTQKAIRVQGDKSDDKISNESTLSYEFIVVNDGSTDKTSQVAQKYAEKLASKSSKDTFRLIEMKQNSGKGAAIQTGMLLSNSHFCLMVDADGATDINDLTKLMKEMMNLSTKYQSTNANDEEKKQSAPYAVIGSRAHLQDSSTAERTKIRTFLMHSFHFFVHHLCSKKVHDTQCGFKLFNRTAAYLLFSNLHLKRWAFDIEIITIAEQLNVPLSEIAVNWKEIDGSKLDTSKFALAIASIEMLRDMVFVRLCYSLQFWKIKSQVE